MTSPRQWSFVDWILACLFTVAISAAVIGFLGCFFDVLAQSVPQPRNFHVAAVEPVIVGKFAPGVTFVIGPDGTARTCPTDKGVGIYVRDEGARQSNAFFNVLPGQVVMTDKTHKYTIACLKVE